MEPEIFSKYEKARILGARALQISMDAPLLKKFEEKELDDLNFDPLRLAEAELNSDVLPISVNRPMPEKKLEKLEGDKDEKQDTDEEKEKVEEKEVKEIAEEGEIMALATPEDEQDSDDNSKPAETA
jgi:DNA-directed RNA polymerase subunit K/omega